MLYWDELYANGIDAYTRNGVSARRLVEQAPAAAAEFRRQVNENPVLSRYFQLNSLFPAGLLGGGATAGLLEAPQGDDAP